MDKPLTCGNGLAQRAALASRLSALSAALADNLEQHQHTLDLADTNARKEKDAYEGLAREYRDVASQLQATADRMMSYRDLPMARHDAGALSAPAIHEAFATFVERERELLMLLERSLQQDEGMLAEMTRSSGGAR